jgi:hypothetical protein
VDFVVGNSGAVVEVERGFFGEFRIFFGLVKGIVVIVEDIMLTGGFLGSGVHFDSFKWTLILVGGHDCIDPSDILLNGNTLFSSVLG